MSRNRKHGSSAIRLCPVIETLLLCLVTAGAGVGYVWQKEQINSLSRQIAERGVRLARLTDENQNRRRLLADLRSLTSLEARIKELNLGLAPPSLTQTWHLAEPPREAPKPAAREAPGRPRAGRPGSGWTSRSTPTKTPARWPRPGPKN